MYLVLFFYGSRIDIRSVFLRLIISNCYVDGGKARFYLKKSLSLFVKTPNLNIWQDILCNSRTDEIKDLLQFGKDIKVFLEKMYEKHNML